MMPTSGTLPWLIMECISYATRLCAHLQVVFSDFAITHLESMTERETTDDGDEGEILWNCHVTVIYE